MSTQRLKVRCCCAPTRVLGTLPFTDPIVGRCHYIATDGTLHELQLQKFAQRMPDSSLMVELAVNSHDRPLAFWRSLVGFEEEVTS